MDTGSEAYLSDTAGQSPSNALCWAPRKSAKKGRYRSLHPEYGCRNTIWDQIVTVAWLPGGGVAKWPQRRRRGEFLGHRWGTPMPLPYFGGFLTVFLSILILTARDGLRASMDSTRSQKMVRCNCRRDHHSGSLRHQAGSIQRGATLGVQRNNMATDGPLLMEDFRHNELGCCGPHILHGVLHDLNGCPCWH